MSVRTLFHGRNWVLPLLVFAFVAAVQLWLVARAGTDIPFYDQWDVEGAWLYPAWLDGTLRAGDLFTPHNEHRIVWTHLLNLGLFAANGQWDPLLQMAAGAALRAACAAVLFALLAPHTGFATRALVAAGIGFAFLPHLAWHNALWGFQSQVYFCLLFSLLALVLLVPEETSLTKKFAGLFAGLAALLAMGAGAFVPLALFGLAVLRSTERRGIDRAWWRGVWPAMLLLGAALALRVTVPSHAVLGAQSAGDFFRALGRMLAWPHVAQPWAAIGLNAPLVLAVGGRLLGRRRAAPGEDVVVAAAAWALLSAAAAAWTRGGGGEFAAGVPARYADFVVLLPLANAWCAVTLTVSCSAAKRRLWRTAALAWATFLLVGWLGLSVEILRNVILPRARNREAPVRLAVAFQATGDARVLVGQPRLLIPHPNPESVRAVLNDPRMRGSLPPSLQPEKPSGPLSRAVRRVLGVTTAERR